MSRSPLNWRNKLDLLRRSLGAFERETLTVKLAPLDIEPKLQLIRLNRKLSAVAQLPLETEPLVRTEKPT